VAVMENTNAAGKKYLDAIIIDSKLSAGTDFTPNQKKADDLGIMAIKSSKFTKIKGADLSDDLLQKGGSINKQGLIKKWGVMALETI